MATKPKRYIGFASRAEYQRHWRNMNPSSNKASQRKYRNTHKEKIREKDRKWKAANPDKVRLYDRKSKETHREARKKQQRDKYHAKREELRRKQNEWRASNRRHVNEQARNYSVKHADRLKERRKRYCAANKGKIAARQSKWRSGNKDKIRRYSRSRYRNNINHNIATRFRTRICEALRTRGKGLGGLSRIYLGCSWDDLRRRIESQFKPGMTWENRHLWHIDHIIPCSAFNLTDWHDKFVCFSYLNLQPLWAKENLKKSNKHPYHL